MGGTQQWQGEGMLEGYDTADARGEAPPVPTQGSGSTSPSRALLHPEEVEENFLENFRVRGASEGKR